MLKQLGRTIYRTLDKNKRFSIISIGGLAIGIVVVLLIVLWIHDELSFNKCYKNYDTVAEVMRNDFENGQIYTSPILPIGLGTLLKSSYGNYFEKVAIVRSQVESRIIASGEAKFTENGFFMQPDGPTIFSFEMVYGSQNGLKDINSIMLSESLAKKLFGVADPVNQLVKMDATWDLRVTGVYKDMPNNSEFREASYLIPLDQYINGWLTLDSWNNYNMKIYVQLHSKAEYEHISVSIKDVMKPYSDISKPDIFLHPMSRWHLYSQFENGLNITSEQLKYVWMYGIIGFIVLLLACINFMNLYTARSEKYAKEIGIRKTIGSTRQQLIRKFLGETFLMTVVSFALALFLTGLVIPWFSEVTGKELSMQWNNQWYWIFSLAFIIVTTFLAGSYPAFYLSSFDPIIAIRGGSRTGVYRAFPRKLLVIFQFAISISLIISTLTVNKQIQFAKERPVGYTREGLISLRPGSSEFYGKYDLIRNELINTGVVEDMATSNYPVTNTLGNNRGFEWDGKDPEFNPTFNTIDVSYEYGKTIGLQFIEGRDFSREFHTDLSGVLINESALNLMGLKSPINKIIWKPSNNQEIKYYTIIGVVKDMVKGSPFEPARPSIIFPSENNMSWLYVRIKPSISANAALPKIEAALSKIMPSTPFNYKFADQEYNAKFKEKEQIGKMAAFFTIFAIIISCLGLFGLAIFLAENRTKEIGIRKINGAKEIEIILMLNKDFIKWVAIAFAIASPIAWYAMNKWLESFVYKTELSWWLFIGAGIISMAVALLTVSWQSWRAATRNPVEALRYE